jgi:hypothetical protein
MKFQLNDEEDFTLLVYEFQKEVSIFIIYIFDSWLFETTILFSFVGFNV